MEWLAEGIMVTILGVATVFAILIIISLVIYITSMAVQSIENTDIKKDIKAPVKTAPAVKSVKSSVNTDEELIAVITAAIATAESADGNSIDPDKLIVRSLRKVNTWNKEAIQEQQINLF